MAQLSEFDRKPYLFNFKNGTYDLEHDILRPARREDYLTQVSEGSYRPDAVCPVWLRFIENSFPSKSIRDYLQRWFGYCLSGLSAEKAAPIFHGKTDNGKMTMLRVILSIFGYDGDHCYGKYALTRVWAGDLADNITLPTYRSMARFALIVGQFSEPSQKRRYRHALNKD